MIIAALGEFAFHWWNDLGLWRVVDGLALTVAFGLVAASRFQVRELGSDIRQVGADVREVGAGVRDLQQSHRPIEGSSARIEGNTAETVTLLREIRDRLPRSGLWRAPPPPA